MKVKIDKVHILSTVIVLIMINIYCLINNHNIELIFLINAILILFTYCIVNIPGAYLTSIRIRIFEIIYYENSDMDLKIFENKLNDKLLFDERFLRLQNFNLLSFDGESYQLNSNKIKLLIGFVNTMKLIFKKINKY